MLKRNKGRHKYIYTPHDNLSHPGLNAAKVGWRGISRFYLSWSHTVANHKQVDQNKPNNDKNVFLLNEVKCPAWHRWMER